MSRPTLLSLIGLAGVLLAACGSPEGTRLHVIDDTEDPTPVVVERCAPEAVWVTPAAGETRVLRTQPIVIHHPGGVIDVAVRLRSGSGSWLAGDVYTDADQTLVVPWSGWPANADVHWQVTLCGRTLSGQFETGALLRAPDEETLQEVYLNEPFSLDARVGEWSGPLTDAAPENDGGAMAAFRWRFGPSFLITMTEVNTEDITLRLAPAVADSSGTYAQDRQRRTYDLRVPREGAAYLELGFPALEVTARGQPVVLREARFEIGMGPDGYADTAISGEMDLRKYFEDGRPGCELVETLTEGSCQPCSSDHEVACVPFEVTGLTGLLAGVELEPAGPIE
jgi:hypothetical protein